MRKKLKPKLKKNVSVALGAGIALVAATAVAVSVVASKKAIERRAVSREISEKAAFIDVKYQQEQLKKQQDEQLKSERRSSAASWLLGALSFAGTLALQFLWFLASSLFAQLTLAPISTLLGFFGDVLITFFIILAIFGILFKRLYPGHRLKELYTLKNLALFLLASLVISGIKLLASLFSPDYIIYTSIVQCLITVAVLAFAWSRAVKATGYFGKQLKKQVQSPSGKLIFVSLALASIVFALIKVAVSGLAVIGSYAHAAIVFLLCAALAFGIYKVVRAVQKRLDITALLPSPTDGIN